MGGRGRFVGRATRHSEGTSRASDRGARTVAGRSASGCESASSGELVAGRSRSKDAPFPASRGRPSPAGTQETTRPARWTGGVMNSPNEESGANGRLCEVLAAYLEAEDAGWAPPPNEIVTCYPELEAELAAYFQGQDHVARLAESLPLPSPGEGQDAGWAFPASADAPTKDESASATNPSMESPSAFGDYVLR